jgi:hypothetical protein
MAEPADRINHSIGLGFASSPHSGVLTVTACLPSRTTSEVGTRISRGPIRKTLKRPDFASFQAVVLDIPANLAKSLSDRYLVLFTSIAALRRGLSSVAQHSAADVRLNATASSRPKMSNDVRSLFCLKLF